MGLERPDCWRKQFVNLDGSEGKAYERIGDAVVFSPDSKRVAYAARVGNKGVVVVDGTEGKAYDDIAKGGPIFSPDSKRVAYGATQRAASRSGRIWPRSKRSIHFWTWIGRSSGCSARQ